MTQLSLFGPERRRVSWKPKAPPSLSGVQRVQLDFETDGLDIWGGHRMVGVAVGYGGQYQYLPIRHKGGGNLPEGTVIEWMHHELRGKLIENFNTRFDIHVAYKEGIDLEQQGCSVTDIAHWDALLDDHRPPNRLSLDNVAFDYLGERKVQGLDKDRMADYHAGEVAEYAMQDVRLVDRLSQHMQPLLVAQDLLRVKALEDRVIYPVCSMERYGAPINEAMLDRWLVETEQAHLRALWEITEHAGFQCNPDSNKDLERLFRKLDIPILAFSATGKPSFTDDVLANVGHPAAAALRKARKIDSLRSKFLLPYKEQVRRYGCIRYSLHQLRSDDGGTISGRFSSSKINIQQVATPEKQRRSFGDDCPWIVRELFQLSDEMLQQYPEAEWLCADAKQIEYRLFAHYSKAPKVLAAYAKDPDTDFHANTRDMILDAGHAIPRKLAKDINFAKIYGAGPNKIAAMLHLTRAEADVFVRAYDAAFPEAERLLHETSRLASSRGWVKTLEGRRSRFPDKQFLHAALNRVIQGSAADVNKTKIAELHETRKETGFQMYFTVHDEADGLSPDKECTAKVSEVLNRQSYDLKVPILWDVGTGKSWGEAK